MISIIASKYNGASSPFAPRAEEVAKHAEAAHPVPPQEDVADSVVVNISAEGAQRFEAEAHSSKPRDTFTKMDLNGDGGVTVAEFRVAASFRTEEGAAAKP